MAELALRSLDIVEYRGLGGMKLEDFGRINLLVGGNNSGKTSVLEALALFARPLDIGNWVETAWRWESKGSCSETCPVGCGRRLAPSVPF